MLSEEERRKVRELTTGIAPMSGQGCIAFALCANRIKIRELEQEMERLLAPQGFELRRIKLATRTSGRKSPLISIHVEDLPRYFETLDNQPGGTARPAPYLIHELPSVIEKQTLENPERSSPFVQLLNYRREVFRDEAICALFWTDKETLAYLAEKAPDFWSFRSKTVEFPPEAEPGRLREMEAVTTREPSRYTSRQKIDERLKEIESQLAIYRSKEPPDENAVAGLLLEAGGLSFDKHEMQDALRLLFDSQRIFERLQLLPQQRNSFAWIGRTFQQLGQLDSAERYLRQALDIDERLNNQSNLSTDYNNLSVIYIARRELKEAEAWLRRAIAIEVKSGNETTLDNI